MKKNIKNDFVSIINYRGYRGILNHPQFEAYYDCYEKNNKKYKWLSFFDLDEFLVLKPKNMKINKLLNMSIKDPSNREISIFKENIDKSINTYKSCGNFECDISHLYIKTDHPLYKPNYLFTTIELILMNEFSQKKEIFILICRFLGNYFKILNEGKSKIIIIGRFCNFN